MRNELTKPKMQKKRRPYPEKYRRKQAERIRETRPWERSTGPKTDEGKASSAANSLRHGFYTEDMAALRAVMRAQARFLARLRIDGFI